MKIRLAEIPHGGRSFDFSRKTAELNENLKDLIGDHDYSIDFTINPIGNAYEMRGEIKTAKSEVCSTCGYDFELKINRRFNEILFEENRDLGRKSHSVHGNQSVDFTESSGGSLEMTPVAGGVFDPGLFAHEAIAIGIPFYPTCGDSGTCVHEDEVEKIKEKLRREFEAADLEEPAQKSPFAVLQNLELKKN